MRPWSRLGVRGRAVAVAVVVVGLALAGGSAALAVLLDGALHEQAETAARIQAAEIASIVSVSPSGRVDLPKAEAGVYVEVLARGGRVVASDVPAPLGASGSAGGASAARAFLPRLAPAGRNGLVETVSALPGIDEDPYLLFAEPMSAAEGLSHPAPGLVPAGWSVEVAEPLAWPVHVEHLVVAALALGVPALVILVGLVVWWLSGKALAPVEAIRAEVDAVSAGDLTRRVEVPPQRDVVARLASTMNAMLERLEHASERQKRFTSDASHELKSPIASIQAQLEVSLAHPKSGDWRQVAAAALEDLSRLQRLADDLLVLARVDEGALGRSSLEVIGLRDVLLAEAERVAVGSLARKGPALSVDASGVGEAHVLANLVMIERVVGNLADNALRHANSKVAFSLRTESGLADSLEPASWVVIEVADDGEGIPPGERERVFERFVRLDEGRDATAGGSGLGLAIVRQVVEAYGGSVEVRDGIPWPSGEGRGACFTVRLPALDDHQGVSN